MFWDRSYDLGCLAAVWYGVIWDIRPSLCCNLHSHQLINVKYIYNLFFLIWFREDCNQLRNGLFVIVRFEALDDSSIKWLDMTCEVWWQKFWPVSESNSPLLGVRVHKIYPETRECFGFCFWALSTRREAMLGIYRLSSKHFCCNSTGSHICMQLFYWSIEVNWIYQ